jgi:hypothetical protein
MFGPTHRFALSRVAAPIRTFAVAVAFATTNLMTPVAHADITTVAHQCQGLGGTLTRAPGIAGARYAWQCCYVPLVPSAGTQTCDYYDEDGNFVSSGADSAKPPKPTLAPGAPTQAKPSVPPAQTAH